MWKTNEEWIIKQHTARMFIVTDNHWVKGTSSSKEKKKKILIYSFSFSLDSFEMSLLCLHTRTQKKSLKSHMINKKDI